MQGWKLLFTGAFHPFPYSYAPFNPLKQKSYEYRNNHYSKYIPVAGRTGSVSVYARLQQYFMDAPLVRPDVDYLERPFRYDYPGRGMQIIFSLLVLFVGAMSLLTLLDKNLSQTVTPGQWFDSMSLVLPACQVSCILFMRQEYNDPFEYADRLTGFSMWKVTAALCLIPLLWLPYVAGLLDSSMYRFTDVPFYGTFL